MTPKWLHFIAINTIKMGSKMINLDMRANGNNIPDNYDEVRDDFVKALIEFYEMKSPKDILNY